VSACASPLTAVWRGVSSFFIGRIPCRVVLTLAVAIACAAPAATARASGDSPAMSPSGDGFLTMPRNASPTAIALGYLHRHDAAFGLTRGDISSLRLTRDYTDVDGITHLIWAQVFDGIQALDNGVYANVAKDGRLINIMGSPISDLGVRTTQPDVSARGALSAALNNAGVAGHVVPAEKNTRGADRLTKFAGGTDDARLVLYTEAPGVTRLAWRVTAEASSTELYDYVIDASNGSVLHRENTVDSVTEFGYVWESAPNLNAACTTCVPAAGAQGWHEFPYPWGISTDGPLSGTFATVYTDIDDDGQADAPSANCGACGYTPPNARFGRNDSPAWNYPFSPNPGGLSGGGGEEGSDCSDTFPQCSWYRHNPGYQGWQTNLQQNQTQVYWYVNNFHDWLKDTKSIGFNAASGAFEGGDRIQVETFNGADTGLIPGTPDSNHLNTASMSTQRDGIAPKMQLSLFDQPGTADVQTNAGDDASIVYHEYAHGLSSRLVTDASGAPALNSFQARSMGEGWSDWYALDYLERKHRMGDDTGIDGEMNMGLYVTGGDIHSIRTQGLDCQVGSATSTDCPGGASTGAGGYTLGDMGHVANGPDYHADGEIWSETLWDLRHIWEAGSTGIARDAKLNAIRHIVTSGMRLSPPNPSMLDERNAILQAAKVGYPNRPSLYHFVWRTFAHRGMGYFAYDRGSSDTRPHEDFNRPPKCGVIDCGALTGRVTEPATGRPVENVTVAFREPGDLVATTNSRGRYVIRNIPPHTYSLLSASHAGFTTTQRRNVTVGTGTTTLDLPIRRG
jgi:extracellular elastinolytic metalloproteinase